MQQRVGVVRALANEPDVLLMDEPFASVDAQTRMTLQEELTRIWERAQADGGLHHARRQRSGVPRQSRDRAVAGPRARRHRRRAAAPARLGRADRRRRVQGAGRHACCSRCARHEPAGPPSARGRCPSAGDSQSAGTGCVRPQPQGRIPECAARRFSNEPQDAAMGLMRDAARSTRGRIVIGAVAALVAWKIGLMLLAPGKVMPGFTPERTRPGQRAGHAAVRAGALSRAGLSAVRPRLRHQDASIEVRGVSLARLNAVARALLGAPRGALARRVTTNPNRRP